MSMLRLHSDVTGVEVGEVEMLEWCSRSAFTVLAGSTGSGCDLVARALWMASEAVGSWELHQRLSASPYPVQSVASVRGWFYDELGGLNDKTSQVIDHAVDAIHRGEIGLGWMQLRIDDLALDGSGDGLVGRIGQVLQQHHHSSQVNHFLDALRWRGLSIIAVEKAAKAGPVVVRHYECAAARH